MFRHHQEKTRGQEDISLWCQVTSINTLHSLDTNTPLTSTTLATPSPMTLDINNLTSRVTRADTLVESIRTMGSPPDTIITILDHLTPTLLNTTITIISSILLQVCSALEAKYYNICFEGKTSMVSLKTGFKF